MNKLLLNKGSPSLLGHKVSGLKIIKGIQRGEAWEPLFSETYLGPRLCNQTDQSCIEPWRHLVQPKKERRWPNRGRGERQVQPAERSVSGALVTLQLQGGTSEGPVQENDTSKDVFLE